VNDETLAALGASRAAIAAHYDTGDDFFALWLDPAMVYTCARWDGPDDTLEAAQTRKLAHVTALAGVRAGHHVLDIGCGWGGLLAHVVREAGAARATGLTLGARQHAHVTALGVPEVEARLEGWQAHHPPEPYDAITSVEAIEAFARHGLTAEEKLAVYASLFERCHAWLRPGGMLVIQAITYGNAGPEDFDPFIATEIFPESDLPTLAELAAAWSRRFEVRTVENRREDYVRTLRAWLRRLKARREEAVALVGEDVVVRFERYLRLSVHMFQHGTCDLLTLALRRVDAPRGL
jgi:cyclopropane-fatty-acyl-phospholipid synthase